MISFVRYKFGEAIPNRAKAATVPANSKITRPMNTLGFFHFFDKCGIRIPNMIADCREVSINEVARKLGLVRELLAVRTRAGAHNYRLWLMSRNRRRRRREEALHEQTASRGERGFAKGRPPL
jgi:hypothetical protein